MMKYETKYKIGEIVFSLIHQWCKVIDWNEEENKLLIKDLYSDETYTYTGSGKIDENDLEPLLYLEHMIVISKEDFYALNSFKNLYLEMFNKFCTKQLKEK